MSARNARIPSATSRHGRLGGALLIAGVVALLAGAAHARRPPPQPLPTPMPTQPAAESVRFICDTPVDAPRSVRAAFEEFHACVGPEVDGWLEAHPEALAGLEQLHDRWMEGRGHDLRDRPEAGRWTRRHPTDFAAQEVELTSRQVEQLAPTVQGAVARVPGVFQRLFVDRASERLFLTTASEGLVSVDISERYAFTLEGRVGSAGATDFFIVDAQTAVVEETVEAGGNRDLVVLDISDRTRPREVVRLRGVLPEVTRPTTFHAGMRKVAPTFDQYRLIREGLAGTRTCGAPPTVSTHPGIHCRRDGSCFRRETVDEPNEGLCERIPPAQRRVAVGRIVRTDGAWAEREVGPRPQPTGVRGGRGAASGARPESPERSMMVREEAMGAPVAAAAPPAPSAAPSRARRAESTSAPVRDAAPPTGGAGGAGSLSQMMMHGRTLYVLSASHDQPEGWLTTFDLTQPRRPALAHVIRLDNGPEALQRHDNLLLVAGRDALVTASVGLSTAPRLLGEYRQDCPVTFDPVVVQGSIAYRTIIIDQPNNACSSRLEVIELSQPHQPVLRTTRAIDRPRGMAVLGERLFVADERRGVHVFDLTDAVNPSAAGLLPLPGVQDLVLAGFDLFALTPDRIETFWVGALFERGVRADAGLARVEGFTTVQRGDNVRVPGPENRRR